MKRLVFLLAGLFLLTGISRANADTDGTGYERWGYINCAAPFQVLVTAKSIGNIALGVSPGGEKDFRNLDYRVRSYTASPIPNGAGIFWYAENLDWPSSGWIMWAKAECVDIA